MGNKEEIRIQKDMFRKEAKAYRNSLSEEERLNLSSRINTHLCQLNDYREAEAVLMYASLPGEVDTLDFIKRFLSGEGTKKLYCPVTTGDEMEFYQVKDFSDLKEGNFHVLEPEPIKENLFIPQENIKFCIIIPGLMFDKTGNRLGYGRGYYDNYLAKLPANAAVTTFALSYGAMVKDEIPNEETDQKIDYIVTEKDLYASAEK